jgi:hypothetical protein
LTICGDGGGRGVPCPALRILDDATLPSDTDQPRLINWTMIDWLRGEGPGFKIRAAIEVMEDGRLAAFHLR